MRIQLGKIFDDDKRLLLLETGLVTIEQLLKEESEKVLAELKVKKAQLQELKTKNTSAATTIKESNSEVLTLEDDIDKIALELISINLHEARVTAHLAEKKKEYEDVKAEYEKKKAKAEEDTSNLKYKENQLTTMKSNLKEEQEKLENTNKRNNEIIDEILTIYKESLLISESNGDEELKNGMLKEKLNQEKQTPKK